MLNIRVRIPRGETARLQRFLDPARLKQVEAESLNRTRNNVRREGARLISAYMGIPRAKLAARGRGGGNKFGAVRNGTRATRRRLYTSVFGAGRPFNVTRWKPTIQRDSQGRQESVTHQAWGRKQTAEGTWMLVNKPGRPVVVRSGKSFRGVWGPGVAQVMSLPVIFTPLSRFTQERFAHHFRSRMRYRFP